MLWRGLWRWKSLYPQYKRDDFWDVTSPRSEFWDPPAFGQYMSRNRFKDITSAFCLRMASDTEADGMRRPDRFWEIRQMQEEFNKNMQKVFSDEIMVKWLNEYAPGWMAVGRKPSPFGNEYHTVACGVIHVIFWLEIVEGKSRPPHLGPLRFVNEHGKLVALVLRACEGMQGTNRVVFMDSGFGVKILG